MYDHIYVIGDIHGMYYRLQGILDKLEYGEKDLLIFLGDYVDRGEYCLKCLDVVHDMVKSGKAVALKGNHERMMEWYFAKHDIAGAKTGIDVVVHPQSIVHSMVQFRDGTVMAQLGCTDMRLPIQYALTYPERVESKFPRVDFFKLGQLTFMEPDLETFKGLKLAFSAGRTGGTMPCIMNAANEVAVEAFLKGQSGFLKIYDLIERAMDAGNVVYNPTLEQLLEADQWAREFTRKNLTK